MFEFKPCKTKDEIEFAGLYEIQPEVFNDSRGNTFEIYSERDFFNAGLKINFVQDNQSCSLNGVLRGLHFQKHYPQGKLVYILQGKIYDVVVDLRQESATFGKWHNTVLDAEKHNMLYIPEGFAHGFFVLSQTATFAYKCTDFYHPEDEGGILWNDPTIAVDWQLPAQGGEILLSEKDKRQKPFDAGGKYFDINGKWIGE